MIDPFRGEMTARYVEHENLDWAERERLARRARPVAGARTTLLSKGWALLGRLLFRHRKPQPLPRPRLAH